LIIVATLHLELSITTAIIINETVTCYSELFGSAHDKKKTWTSTGEEMYNKKDNILHCY
jgi:hypothetical protein